MDIYRFDDFELDLAAQQLRQLGRPVALERRPFDLLVLLVTNGTRLTTREDIIDALWSARRVIDFDSGVNTLVRKVRHALGDTPEAPRYVETVPGRGYRFVAPVTGTSESIPPGDVQTETARRFAPASLRRVGAVLLLLLLVGIAAFVAWRPGVAIPGPNRIAVLPFDNLAGDGDLDFLSSGLAEDLSISLGRIDLPGLAVIGGVSSRALAESGLPLRDVAEKFSIDYVINGSLRLEGTRLRVSARLVRTWDGEQVWSAAFDRELTDALGLQQDLGAAITEQVRQSLSPDVQVQIRNRQTENPKAYALYLKGREAWSRMLPSSVDDAVAHFEQAVAIDPDYGLAWAGMAHALTSATMTVSADPLLVQPRAKAAMDRALATAPDLAETQFALAAYLHFLTWDDPAAEVAARRAVELDPNIAMAWMTLAVIQNAQGKHVDARESARRARELDPLFPLLYANSAYLAGSSGDMTAAVDLATQAIAMNPDFWVGYYHLGITRLRLSDWEGALVPLAQAERLSGGQDGPRAWRAVALARLGREAEAREILATLESPRDGKRLSANRVAAIYVALGETDTAIAWLNRAVDQHEAGLIGLANNPVFESLQGDPRFIEIERRTGHRVP